jgi:RHS repeat-associated protein
MRTARNVQSVYLPCRLTEVKNAKGASVLSDYVSTLDPVGNPTQIVETGAAPLTETFGYDANDRITSVCFQAGTCSGSSDPFIRWTYDKVGNRLTESRHTGSNTVNIGYTYNGLDQLTQASAQTLAVYSPQVQTDGAQPYWRLGETAGSTTFASTVGSYTGTWGSGHVPTLGQPGALGGDTDTAATFSGSQYGNVPNASGLNKTNNFTLELWLKRSTNATLQAVAGKPLTTTTKSENYAIWIDASNDARFEVGNGTNKSQILTCTAHALDTSWHHIVGTFASGAMKIYYDGSLCNSATASFTTAGTNTSTFDIGRAGTSNYYGGSLDEVALYSTALTAVQVTDHYNKGINNAVATTYGYDNNGNETAASSTILSYDLANRLKSYASGGTTTTYSYDGDGNRLQSSTGTGASQKTNYIWDTNAALPQIAVERDGNNALLRRYIYGLRRVSMNTGGADYYYQYDPIGSVTNVTSANGATEWTDSYEPFGGLHNETKNDPSAPANPVRFAGEYLDPTGLYNLRARAYDSSIGRLISVDPIQPDSTSPYTSAYVYATNRPTYLGDPTGMCSVPLLASSAGIGCPTLASSRQQPPSSVKHDAAVEAAYEQVVLTHVGHIGPVDFDLKREWRIKGSGPTGGTGRADLALLYPAPPTHAFIWEIKPDNRRGIAAGKRQLDRYVQNAPNEGVRGQYGYLLLLNETVNTAAGTIEVRDGPYPGLVVYQSAPTDVAQNADPCSDPFIFPKDPTEFPFPGGLE